MDHSAPAALAENGRLTKQLAASVLSISYDTLLRRDVEQIEKLILDHLGCTARGATMPWGEALRAWAEPHKGSGKARIMGTQLKTAPAIAAFVNATAAHGLELDDTHDESVSHPGAPVIATALALASHAGYNGKEVLAAIAAGYEVIGRVGAATGANAIIANGFHPTSLFTPFGAAATAGHLLRLSPEQLCHAWGLALSMAGGSMQFSQETSGTTVKRLHGGYGALHGVMAAELARLGIDGPLQAFDGAYGLCNNFGSKPVAERLAKAAIEPLEIHRVSFKPYPCCRLFHSTLDALREVTDDFTLAPEKIARINVGGPSIMVSQHMISRPASVMAAQYSLPYTLGAAFYHGPTSVDGFSVEAMKDQRILAIADKVSAEFCQQMEDQFPAHFGSWIELTDTDGNLRRSDVLDSLGTPANPMSVDVLIEKFDSLTAELKLPMNGAEVMKTVGNLRRGRSAKTLLSGFCR